MRNNGSGYHVDGQFNTLNGNIAEDNTGRGFVLFRSASNTLLERNTARDNNERGFLLIFGANDNTLSNNAAERNQFAGLSEEFVLNDLTVVGSLAGGGDLGNVDLIYVPEPASALLLAFGIAIALAYFRRANG